VIDPPVLRSGGVKPDQVKLIGADGNRSAYDRIRKGDEYQVVTVSGRSNCRAGRSSTS
jgi:ribose transport system substrate-binding protein